MTQTEVGYVHWFLLKDQFNKHLVPVLHYLNTYANELTFTSLTFGTRWVSCESEFKKLDRQSLDRAARRVAYLWPQLCLDRQRASPLRWDIAYTYHQRGLVTHMVHLLSRFERSNFLAFERIGNISFFSDFLLVTDEPFLKLCVQCGKQRNRFRSDRIILPGGGQHSAAHRKQG